MEKKDGNGDIGRHAWALIDTMAADTDSNKLADTIRSLSERCRANEPSLVAGWDIYTALCEWESKNQLAWVEDLAAKYREGVHDGVTGPVMDETASWLREVHAKLLAGLRCHLITQNATVCSSRSWKA